MRRILLRATFLVLVLAELALLTNFLPGRWQSKVYAPLSRWWWSRSYDYSRITHPNLEGELEPFEPWINGAVAVLAVLNGAAIVTLRRRLRISGAQAQSSVPVRRHR
jgi:hypothetical protein